MKMELSWYKINGTTHIAYSVRREMFFVKTWTEETQYFITVYMGVSTLVMNSLKGALKFGMPFDTYMLENIMGKFECETTVQDGYCYDDVIQTVVLVDFSWLYHRSKRAFAELSYEVGGQKVATGALYGVHDGLLSIFEHYGKKVQVKLCLDGTAQKQNRLSKGKYKSDREYGSGTSEFINISRDEVADKFRVLDNVTVVKHEKMEADDTIGYLVYTKEKEDKYIIMSGDGDLRQFINTEDNVFCTREFSQEKGFTLEDEDYLFKTGIKGLDGLTPWAVGLYLAITGDQSDAITGIPFFNKAMAKEIANSCCTFTGLECVLNGGENTLSDKARKTLSKLKDNIVQLKNNWGMVNIDPVYVPNETGRMTAEEKEKTLQWLDTYGCVKVRNDIMGLMG